MDTARVAQEAVDYLVQHDFVLHWDYDAADPPSDEIKRLLAPYFADGEIELTTGAWLADYLVGCLQEEYLLKGKPSRSGQGHAPSSCPAFRVVRGDED